MQIRRKDKEFIHNLRLLGAGIGVILTVLAVFHLRNNTKNQLSQQRTYVQQNSRLSALTNLQLPKDLGITDNIAGGFLENIEQDNAELARLEKGFLANLSSTDLALLCAALCVAGLTAGYCSVWLISTIAAFGFVKLIRDTYKIIWRIKPDFHGGRRKIQNNDNVMIKRDKHRILPGLIIMSVMALIGLTILWLTVYYCTG